MAIPALVWQVFFCIIPLILIISGSFIAPTGYFFSLKNYTILFDTNHLYIILLSFFLALTTSILCLLFGYPIAYWLARKVVIFKNLFLFLLIVPFWTNLLVLIYSWIFILEKSGILNNFLISIGLIQQPLAILNNIVGILIVTFYCYLPFMVLPIFSVLEKIDQNILEASADLGATGRQTITKVIIPLSWPGIKTGLLLVFVPVFGEFTIPLLIGGDKYMFTGNAIAHYVFTALDLSKGAAFTIIASISLFMSIILLNWLLKRFIYRL